MQKAQSPQTTPSVGVALGGGATLGTAHIGVLKALVEEEIPIHYISGTSAGALVAACFAFGVPLPRMIEVAHNMSWKKFSTFGRSRLGISSNEPMGTFITDVLGDVQIEDAPLPLAIVATDIEHRTMVILRSGRLRDAVRASTSLPGMFVPVEIDGRLLVDGGLMENVPLTALGEMGATFRIGVHLLASQSTARPRHIVDVISSTFSTLSSHRDKGLADADFMIEPNTSAFDMMKFKDIEQVIDEGYRAAMAVMPELKARLQQSRAKHERGWFGRLRRFFGVQG